MPAGSYVIQARDTAPRPRRSRWPGGRSSSRANGTFTLTTPDTLVFTGKLVQKDGMATYTDQACNEPGLYYVRKERSGYAFDVKSETCAGRDAGWVKLLFVPGKPKKSP